MGKNWKGGKGRGGGAGGGSGLSKLRGSYGAILGTCDAGKERECSKELLNVFNQVIEAILPPPCVDNNEESSEVAPKSIKESLADEIAALKGHGGNEKSRQSNQRIMSIDVGIKGLIMIQIKVAEISPVQLIKCLFDKVRIEKVAFTRHVVRLIPLRYVCFPNTDELTRVMETIVKEEFPEFSRKAMKDSSEVETAGDGVPDTEVDGEQSRKRKKVDNEPIAASLISDSIPSVATSTSNIPKTIQYSILFKARNCTGISKNDVHNCIFSEMPGGSITKSNYLNPDSVIVVEAIKSIMGISYFSDYASYGDFNIRKFQMKHTELEVNLNTSAKLNEECSIPATTIDATAAVENNGNC